VVGPSRCAGSCSTWSRRPPGTTGTSTSSENPGKALQILVSRARAQLGSGVVASTPTGYRLALREDQVDTAAVLLSASASARHSRAGDHAAAFAHAEAGLAL